MKEVTRSLSQEPTREGLTWSLALARASSMDEHTHTHTMHACTHTCTCTHFVVPQEEGQQHKHASIMHNPPDINAALGEALWVPRKHGNILGDQQGQVASRGFPNQLWQRPRRGSDGEPVTLVPSCIQ